MENKQQHTPEIARQKLYDEIERAIPTIYNDHLEICETDHTTIDKIMGLVDGYLFAQSKANEERITSLTEQVEQGWISVDERLPEDGQMVLCDTGKGWVLMATYENKEFKRFVDAAQGERIYALSYTKVSHWQPLPIPPSPKDSNNQK